MIKYLEEQSIYLFIYLALFPEISLHGIPYTCTVASIRCGMHYKGILLWVTSIRCWRSIGSTWQFLFSSLINWILSLWENMRLSAVRVKFVPHVIFCPTWLRLVCAVHLINHTCRDYKSIRHCQNSQNCSNLFNNSWLKTVLHCCWHYVIGQRTYGSSCQYGGCSSLPHTCIPEERSSSIQK